MPALVGSIKWRKTAENVRVIVSRRKALGRSRADEPELRTRSDLFVDDFLRIIEAAAALHFAAVTGIGFLRRAGARAGGIADLALRDSIANADDHGDRYSR